MILGRFLVARESGMAEFDGGPHTCFLGTPCLKVVHRAWLEHVSQERVDVAGAQDAIRTDGVIEFDGLGAKDDRENCTTVLAKRGRRVWSLTVRTRPEDGIEPEVEPIVGSFELR